MTTELSLARRAKGLLHGQATRTLAFADEFCLIRAGKFELEVDGKIVKRARRVRETMTYLEVQGLAVGVYVEQRSG